jgi:hypothetical protein
MGTFRTAGGRILRLAALILTVSAAATVASASEKNNLPPCTSQTVRDAAAEAVEDAYTRRGLGRASISRNIADHIRRTLSDYTGNDRAALERANARYAGVDARDMRLCATPKIGGMQVDVWIVTDDKDQAKWRAVVTNIGMGANGYAVSPATNKPTIGGK